MISQPNNSQLIVADADSVTIANRHPWTRIREDQLDQLLRYCLISSMMGVNGIYHILFDHDPFSYCDRSRSRFIMLKYTVDEETGKIVVHKMDLSDDEARILIDNMHELIWS